ncbi:MAG TPA: hypothetical protein VMD30_09495, partial [Tepidisphaeraceae bacterium]|nr:hypothetical protein [Tepidisphaeraceae bacterium]
MQPMVREVGAAFPLALGPVEETASTQAARIKVVLDEDRAGAADAEAGGQQLSAEQRIVAKAQSAGAEFLVKPGDF